LDCILRVFSVPENPKRQVVRAVLVSSRQLIERGAVSGGCESLDEAFVGGRMLRFFEWLGIHSRTVSPGSAGSPCIRWKLFCAPMGTHPTPL